MSLNNDDMPALFLRWSCGNEEAAEFLLLVAKITRLADDIVDDDVEDRAEAMSHLLELAVCMLPLNLFYRAHVARIGTTLWLGLFGWRMSERWKHAELPKTQMFAFVYRELIEQVAYKVAFLCGGRDHAKAVATELHQLNHVDGNSETFEDWVREQADVR